MPTEQYANTPTISLNKNFFIRIINGMKRLLFFILLLSTLSCSKSTKEYIDDGDFKFWYIKYSDSYETDILYLGNNGVCKYFWLYPGGGFEAYKISDCILIEKWKLNGDSIIEIGGHERLILQINDSLMITEAGYKCDWSRIDTFRVAPRTMIPDEYYHRYPPVRERKVVEF